MFVVVSSMPLTLQCKMYRTGYDFSFSSGFINYSENLLKMLICLFEQMFMITYGEPRWVDS